MTRCSSCSATWTRPRSPDLVGDSASPGVGASWLLSLFAESDAAYYSEPSRSETKEEIMSNYRNIRFETAEGVATLTLDR